MFLKTNNNGSYSNKPCAGCVCTSGILAQLLIIQSSNSWYGTLHTNDSVYQWKYSWILIPMWVYAAVVFLLHFPWIQDHPQHYFRPQIVFL